MSTAQLTSAAVSGAKCPASSTAARAATIAASSPVTGRRRGGPSATYPGRATSNEWPRGQRKVPLADASRPEQVGQRRRATTRASGPETTDGNSTPLDGQGEVDGR